MLKHQRQEKIGEIIRKQKVRSQLELLNALNNEGIRSNQAAVSRDLQEMGIFKVLGVYRMPHIEVNSAKQDEPYETITAGDNLIIIRTSPGKAMAVGATVDELSLKEILGTIAGDDTLFIAVKNKKDQSKAISNILNYFHH